MNITGAAYSTLYLPIPEGLVFEGTTDNEGKVTISFPNRELRLGPDFEFGLESFALDSSTMYNVYDGQYTITFKKADNTVKKDSLEPEKIVTCHDLLNALNKLDMGFNMDFSYNNVHIVDVKKGTLYLPVEIARGISLAGADYKVLAMMLRLNPNFTFTEEKIDGKNYIGITTSTTDKLHIPVLSSRNIWNIISPHSFQSLYFYSDIVVGEIISGIQVSFLGVFPFREDQLINTWRDIEPIWRRVAKTNISECYLQVGDSRGRLFKNVQISAHCRIRRRNLK